MFQHFLITRFNLRKSDWTTNKKNVAVLTEEWHKNRFKLFTDFCFPSVVSQTNKNFEWLVFFDTSTPDIYKLQIEALEKQLSNFKPIFADGMDAFLPMLKQYLATIKSEYIITSGLDNDDCISKNYVAEVQKNFDNQNFMAVDYIDGYTLQIAPNYKLGKKLHQYNPFISLIEKNENPKTVSNISHRLWKKEKRILQISNKPIWSSIIHQENKVNEFTGFGAVDLTTFLENFSISKEQSEHIKSNLILWNKWRLTSFTNAISSKWNVIFKNFKKNIGLYN